MNNYDLDTAISSLPEESKKLPVFIISGGPFMDSPLYFYDKGKFYEGTKHKVVREFIKSRGDGKPTKEEIDAVLPKFKAANKGVVFNVVVTQHYGDWVIEGIKITKKTEEDQEFIQTLINSAVKNENFAKFKQGYIRNIFV